MLPGVQALPIDVWSDVACPWCWVGKRHLEDALSRFEHPTIVTWHAFELDPAAPARIDGEVDYVGRLARKYGASRERAQAMIDRMVGVGAEAGLDFRFDRAVPSNTFDAHRLLRWASGLGKQHALKERLFSAYMHEGRAIADHETLVAVASDAGLDPDDFRLELPDDVEIIRQAALRESLTRNRLTSIGQLR